jgi:ATP-binding cassette subfamily F protein 3
MVIVSHDRYFLDKPADKIFEMHGGKLTVYPGNYSAYAKLRAERQLVAERVAVKQQEQIAHYRDFVDRNRYGQLAKQAKSREKMIERIEEELVETIRDVSGPRMYFGEADRAGDVVIEAFGVGMEFPGKPLFADFSLTVQRGERLGLVGPNGAGKTTLLRILLGELEPTAGRAKLGHNVKVGYLDQNLALLDPDRTPLEAVRPPWRLTEKPEPFRALLARFGVGADLAEKRIGVLSGGERTRVALARICAHEVNLLALDEPTNHLDPWACESLEAALAEFDGTVLIVSHDRAFLDNVANRLLYVADGEAKLVAGGYEKLVEYRAAKCAKPIKPVVGKPKPTAKGDDVKPKRKFGYRKAHDLEADILAKESLLTECEGQLVDPDVYRDGRKVKEVGDRIARLKAEIAELYEHWQQAVELNW